MRKLLDGWPKWVGGMLAVCAALNCSNSAEAAKWKVTYREQVSGTTKELREGVQCETPWSYGFFGDSWYDAYASEWSQYAMYEAPSAAEPYATFGAEVSGLHFYDGVDASQDGQYRPVFEWCLGEDETVLPPPPEYLNVKLMTYGRAEYEGPNTSPLVEVQVAFDDTNRNITTAWHGDQFFKQIIKGKQVLLSIRTNGQTHIELPMLNHYAAAAGGGWTLAEYPGIAYAEGGSSARVDTRRVQLSRSGAATPKQKGAAGVTIDESKDEWVDVDGTAYGHTRWSYKERVLPNANPIEIITGTFGYDLYNDDEVIVNQAIGASRSGQWSQNLTHHWTPYSLGDNEAAHSQDMPQGNSLRNPKGIDGQWVFVGDGLVHLSLKDLVARGWYNLPSQGSPNPLVIKYSLTDNSDHATATAKYFLHLHDEWENPTVNTAHSWTDEVGQTHVGVTRGSAHIYQLNVPPTTYTGTNGDPETKTWTLAEINATVGAQAQLTAGFTPSPAFMAKDWLNLGTSFEATASLQISSEYSSQAIVSLSPGDVAYPIIRYYINTKHHLVDHFVESGCDRNPARTDGKWEQSADMPLRIQDIQPSWIVVPAGPPGGP